MWEGRGALQKTPPSIALKAVYPQLREYHDFEKTLFPKSFSIRYFRAWF
jgi:hypothetical protein